MGVISGPNLEDFQLSLALDFSDRRLYTGDGAIIRDDPLISGFTNYNGGSITTEYRDGPFGEVLHVALAHGDNDTNAPRHLFEDLTASTINSLGPNNTAFVADYYHLTEQTEANNGSQFTNNVNVDEYGELYYTTQSGVWQRVLHQMSYTTGVKSPRYFITDQTYTSATGAWIYGMKIYKLSPENLARDPDVYFKSADLTPHVNTANYIHFSGSIANNDTGRMIFNEPHSLTDTGNAFTYETIFQPLTIGNSTSAYNIIMGKVGFHAGIGQEEEAGQGRFASLMWDADNVAYVSSTYNYDIKSIYHLTMTFDGTGIFKFYVNGSQIGNQVNMPSMRVINYGNSLYLGGVNSTYTSQGNMYLARMYKTELTSGQVNNNYKQYKERFDL